MSMIDPAAAEIIRQQLPRLTLPRGLERKLSAATYTFVGEPFNDH